MKEKQRHFIVKDNDYIGKDILEYKHPLNGRPCYTEAESKQYVHKKSEKVLTGLQEKCRGEYGYYFRHYTENKYYKDLYYTSNDDLKTLIALRKSIVEKLHAYHAAYKNDKLVELMSDANKTILQSRKEAFTKASNELCAEFKKYDDFVAKRKGFRLVTQDSSQKTYYADDCQDELKEAQLEHEKAYKKAKDYFDSYLYRVGSIYESRDCYRLWEFRSLCWSIIGIGIPFLIGGLIVHAIDAAVSHLRRFINKTSADISLEKQKNNIDEKIKCNEQDVIDQTLFEIGKERFTEEYQCFQSQRSALANVGFFGGNKTDVQSTTGANAANDNKAQPQQQAQLIPRTFG